MLNVPDDLSLSEGERAILEAALRHTEETNRAIAERTATRIATVRDTREAYADRVELADERTATLTMPTDSASFNAAETAILEAALEDPLRTNAEIAERTGTRVALVRDTREAYEDRVERADSAGGEADIDADEGDDGDIDAAGEDEHTEAERAILAAVASNPDRTNAEIAEETGARMALVRDTRAAHAESAGPDDHHAAGEVDSDEAGGGGGIDSDEDASLSGLQREILEAVADEPTLTNAEIAERTGARITLVRDTREAHA